MLFPSFCDVLSFVLVNPDVKFSLFNNMGKRFPFTGICILPLLLETWLRGESGSGVLIEHNQNPLNGWETLFRVLWESHWGKLCMPFYPQLQNMSWILFSPFFLLHPSFCLLIFSWSTIYPSFVFPLLLFQRF